MEKISPDFKFEVPEDLKIVPKEKKPKSVVVEPVYYTSESEEPVKPVP